MSGENWESLITEKGFMRVPRALRLKRAELGITNNEYTILLDYVDYYSFSGTMNPYRHLTEVSGMSERSIRKALTALEKKGLLRRKVSRHGNGRTNGVVFSIDPLLRKLRTIMKKSSPTVGEEIDPYVGEESVRPNTGEDFNKRDESKNTSAKNAVVRGRARGDLSAREDREKECVEGEMNFGFIRETGGAVEEAPRNDRSGGKAGQIHLARAGKGPHGLFAGEDEEGRVYHPHPGPILSKATRSRRSKSFCASDQRRPNAHLFAFVPSREREVVGCGGESVGGGKSEESAQKGKKKAGGYSPTRWYNEVFRGLYEEAAGQPALTGGREYKSAETYFRRLRELNPDMEPGEVYELAGEGAAFMIASQLEGGVFGWMHKPPDICVLASQAQSVEWHLRKMRRASGRINDSQGKIQISHAPVRNDNEMNTVQDMISEDGDTDHGSVNVRLSLIEKIREGHYASEQIERVYGELRGIESASRGRALPAGNRALRRKRG